jgi:toxin ParE1/3/4
MARRVRWSRTALDAIKVQVAHIARDNPDAASRTAQRIRATGDSLADFATGHPGRVADTYEKSVGGLPYVIAYAIDRTGADEVVVVLHVIHTSRDWREGEWPG